MTDLPTHTAVKEITSPGPKRKAEKISAPAITRTDEEKRLARNAALREWRKKNADRTKAYMAEWRAKRKGKQPEAHKSQPARTEQQSNSPLAATVRNTAPQIRTAKVKRSTSKKSASKKPKKAGKK